MKFSFIISSVDRYDDLKNCLGSIGKAYDYSNHSIDIEILVVFKANGVKNKSVESPYSHLAKFYTYEDVGLSGARNIGIRESSGDYLIFIDDDAKVKEDFLRVLSERVAFYGKVNAFCGRLIDLVQNIPFSVLFSDNSVRKLGRLDFQYFMGSAHVLSRKAVKKIGYYDERFGSGSKFFGSEETDIFFRLKAANEQVLYLPDLIFYHPIPFASPKYVYNYSCAIAACLTKNSINDKRHFLVYFFIALKLASKASIRILQKMLLGGKYKQKDQRCHYSYVLRGMFAGMSRFIKEEL